MNYMAWRQNDEPLNGDYRYEVKFALPESSQSLVTSWVRLHPAGFRQAYPPRQVNSLYFDSHDWGNLREQQAGLAARSKLRLRWYGQDISRADGMLELKGKRGVVGTKASCRVEPFDLAGTSWQEVCRHIARQDLGPLAAAFATCRCPALLNHYRRQYYVSADGEVRLTVDTRLAAYDQATSPVPNLRRPLPACSAIVVELKALACHGSRLQHIASQLPLRSTAFSKYATGLCGVTDIF